MKKVNFYFTLCLLGQLFTTCSSPTTSQNSLKSRSKLDSILLAEGELDIWNNMTTLEFDIIRDTSIEKHIVDLKSRETRIEASNFVLGRYKDSIWVSPRLTAYEGRSARFYHNLWFYFYCLPYVLQDPGVISQVLDPSAIQDTLYNRVKISYASDIGDAPKDQYILHLDKETKELKYLLYSVTYFDSTRAEKYNALAYSDWTNHQGLRFPKKLIGYQWVNDSLGQIRYQTQINLKSINDSRLAPSFFEPQKPYEIER